MTKHILASALVLVGLSLLVPSAGVGQPVTDSIFVRKTIVGDTTTTPRGPFQVQVACSPAGPNTVLVLNSPFSLQSLVSAPSGSVCTFTEIQPMPALAAGCTWVTTYPNGQTGRARETVNIVNTVQCAPPSPTIQAQPAAVNVNSQGSTTAILTFSDLGGFLPAEGTWCSRVMSSPTGRGQVCDPAMILGQTLAGSGQALGSVFTDVMSVPASVTRLAYENALAGQSPRFYYVRHFVNSSAGAISHQYVVVSCLLGGGGAGAPFALTDVRLHLVADVPVLFVQRGDTVPPLMVDLAYTGTGRLSGRWEIVLPGEDPPSARDLLTEASLPIAERGLQRRYLELERFNVLLLPTGRVTLPGPTPARLPTQLDGSYLVLFRVETSEAAFPMPVFRYIVGSTRTASAPAPLVPNVRLRLPTPDARVSPDSALTLSWTDVLGVARYRLQVERVTDGASLLTAIVAQGVGSYDVPPFVVQQAKGGAVRWRVTALDAVGSEVGRSEWRTAVVRPK